MSREEIINIIVHKLNQIQEMSDDTLVPVSEATTPIGGIPGFDSMNGVELTCMVDMTVPVGRLGNVCVSKDGTRALTVGEIADIILEISKKK